jgi:Histidine kinase-, DNA gyrase B-, and HSP90-like ATPase/MEDS: MEthanogen/methylotroph, DcmR Sensory domain
MANTTSSNPSASKADPRSLRLPASADGSHSAHFYSSDPQLIAEVGPRLFAAIAANGAAVIIATDAHRKGLAEYLELRGLDLNRATNQGRWLALDASKALAEFMVGDMPDPRRFADLVGGVLDRLTTAMAQHGKEKAPVAAFGEMVAVLWEKGNSAASIRLEQLWNDLAGTRAFHLSCGWPLDLFSRTGDGLAVADICAEHTHVSPALGYNTMSDDVRRRGGFLWQLKAHKVLQHVSQISRQTLGFYRDASLPVRISISEAIDEVLAIYEYRLRLQDIDVRKNIRPGLEIMWPQGECKHVLSNLIANAVDASSPGAEIYLSAIASHHPVTGVPGVRLVVGDQGIGIPAAVCSRVFSPFFAGRKDINIGLGLWTVKDLLDKRGGTIRCRSRVGTPSGTLMTAFLPMECSPRQKQAIA